MANRVFQTNDLDFGRDFAKKRERPGYRQPTSYTARYRQPVYPTVSQTASWY